MKYATLNSLLGAAICGQGFLFPGLGVPLVWTGLCFLALGTVYALRKPEWLGKRPDGSMAWWSRAGLLPLHLLLWAVWRLSVSLARERAVDTVSARLLVGRRLSPGEAPAGAELVIDLTAEFSEPAGARRGRDYRCFPMLDASAPDIRALREFIAALPDAVTYVHCAQGHGRTGLFSVAYLLERGVCATAAEALGLLSAARPGIALNREQRVFLAAHFG